MAIVFQVPDRWSRWFVRSAEISKTRPPSRKFSAFQQNHRPPKRIIRMHSQRNDL